MSQETSFTYPPSTEDSLSHPATGARQEKKLSRRSFVRNVGWWVKRVGFISSLWKYGASDNHRVSPTEPFPQTPDRVTPTTFFEVNGEKKVVAVEAQHATQVLEKDIIFLDWQKHGRQFGLTDIPEPTAELPALILYTDQHEDQPSPEKSLRTRLIKVLRDVFTPDRFFLILTQNPSIQPAIPTTAEMVSEKRVFYPFTATNLDQLHTLRSKDFSEFPLAEDLLIAIQSGKVRAYWHNFGSNEDKWLAKMGIGTGSLPPIYLVKK